ncbi:MAG: anthranilate phosphoribosyltransferase [Candidatus Schekmanbacteria bacterium]|nr:anthranilate phosphoribosyltransferase [Candidatus Schekmanbacteria bacterium]
MEIREAIERAVGGQDLTEDECRGVMGELMSGRCTAAQISSWITALRVKGETVEEVAGAALAMRERALRVETGLAPLLDTCGTGGDGSHTFNISTAAALVAATAGARVAKHGNRSVSSRCGSADVLEALGVPVALPAAGVAACIREVGFGFLFAPGFHPAMKHAAGPRREIRIRTIFNLLGPLTNPAGAQRQVVGVFAARWVMPMAKVLARLGTEHAFVVHGYGGLDEVSLSGHSFVAEVVEGRISERMLDPQSVVDAAEDGAPYLAGGDPVANAAIMRAVLQGEAGPQSCAVALNAAFALVAGGVAGDLRGAADLARDILHSGKAWATVERLREVARRETDRAAAAHGEREK